MSIKSYILGTKMVTPIVSKSSQKLFEVDLNLDKMLDDIIKRETAPPIAPITVTKSAKLVPAKLNQVLCGGSICKNERKKTCSGCNHKWL